MNVWIENPFDNLPIEGYRPQRYWMMAQAFVDAGHTVTYFTSDFSHAHKRAREFVKRDLTRTFKLLIMPTKPYRTNVSFSRILSHQAYAKTFQSFAMDELARGNQPDVLIVSMPPLSTCAVALDIKALTDCKLVFDIQDAWPETFLRLFPSCLRGLGNLLLAPMRKIVRRAYRGADLLTGVAEQYGALVAGCGAKSYQAFPLGIQLPARRTEMHRPALALVYAGNLGRGYDLGTVISAVLSMDGATLDIAGAGEREDEWKCLAQGHPRIRFHGYLQQEDLNQLLDQCSIGVIPMRDDSGVGVPNKLADYAAHELLTVTSLGGACTALLERYGMGAHYAWGSVASLTAAVRSLAALKPDFASYLRQIDATRIYPEYVKAVASC